MDASAILDVLPDASFLVFASNCDSVITWVNASWSRMTGYDSSEGIGSDIQMLQSTSTPNDIMLSLMVSLQIGEACEGEVELSRKDGSTFSARVQFTPCPFAEIPVGESGVMYLGTVRDMSAHNKMRTIVRQFVESESNQKVADFTRLIETANAPIIGIDNDGRVNEWNAMAASITGHSKRETQGQPLSDFISDEYRESTTKMLQMALAGRETANFEFPLFHNVTKKRVDVLLNATTRRDAWGRVTGVFGFGQDITELRKVSQEVARRADDFTRLIETANAPIFGTDVDGNVTVWNRKSTELTGFQKDEVIGTSSLRISSRLTIARLSAPYSSARCEVRRRITTSSRCLLNQGVACMCS
jgi:PAS domain S-box-containing protein